MLYIVKPEGGDSPRLNRVVEYALSGLAKNEYEIIDSLDELRSLSEKGFSGDGFIFALSIPENGFAPKWYELLSYLSFRVGFFDGTRGGVIVDGDGELYTKDMARRLIFACNSAGMSFPGKPLVEATGTLYNFSTSAMVRGMDKMGAYMEAAKELVEKVRNASLVENGLRGNKGSAHEKRIVMIHAGAKETSNSLMLWEMVKESMETQIPKVDHNLKIEEISVRNGEIVDCRGCGFEACRHFGEKGDCFYGGPMVDKVYPAVLDCDALVLVCPNYNDAVGANMMAVFNRLTALFYNNDFSEKEIYALVVSGYSGGDIVALQIIGAMNINKGFNLPPYFALIATANDPGSIKEAPNIDERAEDFAKRLLL